MHGRSHFIEDAIKSVLSQSYKNIEIILVDDNGSGTENQLHSIDKVKPFISEQLKYITNQHNSGVSATRNRGASLAKGEYITFLDDDDIYYSNKVEYQLQHMLDNELDISVCSFDRFDSEGLTQPSSGIQPELNCAQDLFFKKPSPHAPTIMIKRQFLIDIGGFNEELAYREDLMLVTKALSRGAAIGSTQEPLFKYRVHSGFRLSKKELKYSEIHHIYKTIDKEEISLKNQLTPEELNKLALIRSYKKLDTLYKNKCNIPFELMHTAVYHSITAKNTKIIVKSLSKYLRSLAH